MDIFSYLKHLCRTLDEYIMSFYSVMSSDKSMPNLVLKNIKDPVMVKEIIHKQVEEMKIKRRVRVGEIMGNEIDDADGEFDNELD